MSARLLLSLEVLVPGDLDRALVACGAVSIEKRAGRLLVQWEDADAPRAAALFARAGARVCPTLPAPALATGLHPAVVHDLAPHRALVDRVSVRAVDTGEAAAWLLRRRWRVLRPDAARVSAARRILRGEDHLYAWRRIVWSTAAELRSAPRGLVVPIVFDRDALTRSVERMALADDGLLAAWARA